MNFDFYEDYKSYPNKKLKKILDEPDKHEPDAIIAAKFILEERQINYEESLVVSAPEAVQENEVTELKNASRHANLIAFIFLIEWLWWLISARGRGLTNLWRGESTGIFNYSSFLLWVVLPVTALILFYKRNFVGWLLLFSISLIALTLHIAILLIMLWGSIRSVFLINVLVLVIINLVILFLLSKKGTTNLYGMKKRIAGGSAVLIVIFIVAIVIGELYIFLRLL